MTADRACDTQPYTMVGTLVVPAPVIDPAATSMLMGFQSLGVDCEFGLVQRRFGAEASSLLRWAITPLPALIKMLNNEFQGIGDPAVTSLLAANWGELFLIDHTYDLYNHTFIMDTGLDHRAVLDQQCARLRHLVRKMLDALSNRDKIFVYKSNHPLGDTDMLALYAAFNRFGLNRLLCVTPGPAGVATQVEGAPPTLAVAHIDRPGAQVTPSGADWQIDFEAWLRICDSARQMLAPESRPRECCSPAGARDRHLGADHQVHADLCIELV